MEPAAELGLEVEGTRQCFLRFCLLQLGSGLVSSGTRPALSWSRSQRVPRTKGALMSTYSASAPTSRFQSQRPLDLLRTRRRALHFQECRRRQALRFQECRCRLRRRIAQLNRCLLCCPPSAHVRAATKAYVAGVYTFLKRVLPQPLFQVHAIVNAAIDQFCQAQSIDNYQPTRAPRPLRRLVNECCQRPGSRFPVPGSRPLSHSRFPCLCVRYSVQPGLV